MHDPYGFESSESCQKYQRRSSGFFRQLSATAIRDFDALKSNWSYPKGAILFVEGQHPRGIFSLCGGRVKLSMNSLDGKARPSSCELLSRLQSWA